MERLPQHLLLEAWDDFASGELKKSTVDQYAYWIIKFSANRKIDLHDATNDDVNAWLGSIGGKSKEQAKRGIKHFYRWMRGTKRVQENPTDFVPRYRMARPLPHRWTREVLSRFIFTAAWINEEWAWGFIFIFASGARIGEACRITLEDLDLERGQVVFRESKNGRDEAVNLGVSGISAVRALGNGRPTLLGVSPSALRLRMKKIARLARIPEKEAHPHVLRHTCGTLLAEEMWLRFGTVDKTAIQNHLRHVDPGMTDWYAAVTDPRARATAEMIDPVPLLDGAPVVSLEGNAVVVPALQGAR